MLLKFSVGFEKRRQKVDVIDQVLSWWPTNWRQEMKDDHRADFDDRMEEWVGVNPDLQISVKNFSRRFCHITWDALRR